MQQPDYQLFARYFAGECSEVEATALREWLHASPENRKTFHTARSVWEAGQSMHQVNADDAKNDWRRLAAMLDLDKKSPQLPDHQQSSFFGKSIGRWTAAAAAVVLLMITLSLLIYNGHQSQVVTTQNAQQQTVRLPDGTTVYLNHASQLEFPEKFTDDIRSVSLQGQAYFDVAPADAPFIVKTREAEIEVLGTEFDVWTRNSETRLIVSEGRVQFRGFAQAPYEGLVLAQDESSRLVAGEAPQPIKTVDAANNIPWRSKQLRFEKTPLAEILDELYYAYNIPIAVNNNVQTERTLTGVFRNESIDSVLSAICLTLDLHYQLKDGQYIIAE